MKEFEEQESLNKISRAINNWATRFEAYSYTLDPKFYKSQNYSEVEILVWQKDNLVKVFSIILCLQGKELIKIEDLEEVANEEIESIYEELSK